MRLKLTAPLALLTMCFATGPLLAQRPTKSVDVGKEVVSVAIDRPGDLYVSLSDGGIIRVDSDGSTTVLTEVAHAPNLFDPRDGSRLFAYFRKEQRFSYFSVSREMSSHHLDSTFAIEPWLVCPSGDYNVWIADAADNVIRKVNTTTSHVDAEIQFPDKVSTIKYMREYQGFLFVLHPDRGIVIFSGMGKQLRTLGTGNLSYFNFLGEELYYPNNNSLLTFFNLFNGEERSVKLPRKAAFSLVTDTRIFCVNGSSVEIFPAAR